MRLSWFFGSNLSRSFHGDVQAVNRISSPAFKRVLGRLDEWVFGKEPVAIITNDHIQELTRTTRIDEAAVVAFVRLYSNLGSAFASVGSPDAFTRELAEVGLDREKARLLARSYEANIERLREDLKGASREQFGPTVSLVTWRVDVPSSGSKPFYDEPVGVLSLRVETPTDTAYQRFELSIDAVEMMLESLAEMRRELARLIEERKSTPARR